MHPYKCPSCGRQDLDVKKEDEMENAQTGATREHEAHCKSCGWFGTVEDLKAVF